GIRPRVSFSFIQQFKIPTGSMQPTLNGIIAYPTPETNPNAEYLAPEGYERPGLVGRVVDQVFRGRSHVEWIAEEDDVLLLDQNSFYGKTKLVFFPRTYLTTAKGNRFVAPGTQSRIEDMLNQNLLRRSNFANRVEVRAGDVIARGFVQTGDQLVVDKFTYHWRKPRRGEVFVFNTRDIDGIQNRLIIEERRAGIAQTIPGEPRQGSQHYIKRLVAVPGDSLEIREPQLFINGELATEPGVIRVMEREGRYTGYLNNGGATSVELEDDQYWAMGDNSKNSADSRNWGHVPEKNIVGRAAFVYYPFLPHFGSVK
ncbi:MAG: signal peptidase I, partial [Verrucomicrobiota bacterium]